MALIIDMEMPQNCNNCSCHNECGCCDFGDDIHVDYKSSKRPLDCPLKEVNECEAEDCVSRKKAIISITACNGYSAQIEALENLPSVLPKAKKGHWICDGKGRSFADYHCSECGHKLALCGQDINQRQDSGYSLFCDGCGADMRG